MAHFIFTGNCGNYRQDLTDVNEAQSRALNISFETNKSAVTWEAPYGMKKRKPCISSIRPHCKYISLAALVI
jgi:hypothetical protein